LEVGPSLFKEQGPRRNMKKQVWFKANKLYEKTVCKRTHLNFSGVFKKSNDYKFVVQREK
jgi:hypothetical protein